jgi:hypothetical protein
MIPSNCEGCGRLVLEIKGQFQSFDSYYLDDDGPLMKTVGDWHTTCFLNSPYGPEWHDIKLKNFTAVRGNRLIASTPSWRVIEHPRTHERLAFSRQGTLVSLVYPLGRLRKVDGGSIYRHEDREYNLELEDRDLIRVMQESLLSVKTFPILSLVEALGLTDRLHHPEALEGGLLHYERAFQRDWSDDFVVARWAYGVFIPSELEEYVRAKPLPRSF